MLVNFVIVLTLLIGFCGLAIDVGMLELKKVQLQNAADAAVLGAVYEYERGGTNWKNGGTADAGLNGFTDGASNVMVTISNPPTSGSFSGNKNAIQALVTQQVGTNFISSSYKLAAQAVSLLPPSCLMSLLSTSVVNTLNMTASSFNAACGVYIGRNIQEDSSSSVQAAGFTVVGPASDSSLNGSTQPQPKFNSSIQNDPLATIAQPVFSACTYTGSQNQNNSRTLNPGTYCNNSIWCGNNAVLKLNPGLYIVTGQLNWNLCTVSGTGVTLFMTQGGGSNFGLFQVVNSTVSLSAPTTASQGSIPGILIFMDRAWSGGNQDVQWNQSKYSGDGVWYSTNTGVQIIGNSNVSGSNYLGLVVTSLQVLNSAFNAPYANAPAALASSSFVPAGLVE